ncbi:MAG: NusG domain II-containing protein [Lachnospiraceae bacterium]|nr:NusG domain II-containing protein [Lachnospiraceae bacterium]
MQKRKKDLLLVVIILLIAAIGFWINHNMHQRPAAVVEVTVDSELVETFDLSKDIDTVIHGYKDGTNHLIIQDGAVWISDASCPDKICVHQGHVSLNGDMIVCLPNRMIARIVAPET